MTDKTNIENKTRLFETKENSNALLVGVYSGAKEKEISIDNLNELESLGDTFGLVTSGKILAPIRDIESSTYLKSGKIQEILDTCNDLNIDIVIFDMDISPHQQKNLEKELKRKVIDRTELILGVFSKHAKSREAKLQIKLAALKYEMPRLKRMWTHLSRQRVSGKSSGHLKGEGEKQIEIDRQILRNRITHLQKDINQISKQRQVLRKKRQKSKIPSFAIVGYTNAGKSTLLNALTQANVLVEDKLFATLDTTTRKYMLPNNQEIVLSDTVGFIRKLPHSLIAAFKSTLEEAFYSDILLHIIDVSSKTCIAQAKASIEVLKELNADDKPIITVLNKIDQLKDSSVLTYFKINYPKIVEISAKDKTNFSHLLERMEDEISKLRKIVKLKIPQSYYNVVSEIIKEGRVISTEYLDNDILIEAEIPENFVSRYFEFII